MELHKDNKSPYTARVFEQLEDKFKEVHGDTYDYSKYVYNGSKSKGIIICKVHGEFEQTSNDHLRGKGCAKCAKLRAADSLKSTTFVEEATKVHNGRYSYDKVQYKNANTKVVITCPVHGDFEQTPSDHKNGRGCASCYYEGLTGKKRNYAAVAGKLIDTYRLKREQKQAELIAKLPDTYCYDNVGTEYYNKQEVIVCPIHGEFKARLERLVDGYECPKCTHAAKYPVLGKEGRRLKWQTNAVKRAKEVHGSKYDYSKVYFVNNRTPVTIICKKHGEFQQDMNAHLDKAAGCPKCGNERAGIANKERAAATFVERATTLHKGTYSYTDDYIDSTTKVKIICKEHGEFYQNPVTHLQGAGCPNCKGSYSRHAAAILYYLKVTGDNGEIAYKIGVTKNTVAKRYSTDMQKVEIIGVRQCRSAYVAHKLEKFILNKFKEYKYEGEPLLVSGNTELFKVDILQQHISDNTLDW